MPMSEQVTNSSDSHELPSVAVLILNWNGRSLLATCLPPLLSQAYPHYEVVLIDNGSTDDSLAYMAEHFPQVSIIPLPENIGYARGYNAAFKQCVADFIVLLNNDVIVHEGWLAELIRPFAQDPTIGIVGSKLLFPDGTIQHLGGHLDYPLALGLHTDYRQPDVNGPEEIFDAPYVTGAALAIPQPLLTSLNYFDEAFTPFYYEETDLCYRVRAAGYRVVVNPQATGIHDESTTMWRVSGQKAYAFHKNRLRFVLKHYTAPQILEDFVPAEQQRLRQPAMAHDQHVFRRACLATAVAATDILAYHQNPEQTKAIQQALLSLYHTATMQKPVAYSPVADGWPQTDLLQKQALTELTFHSDIPLAGPLIAAFRRWWHGIAGRWVIGQLIRQQNEFNALVARLLDEQDDRNETAAQEIELLSEALIRLQQHLQALENAQNAASDQASAASGT